MMSENAVTLDSSRVAVSDQSLERTNASRKAEQRSLERVAEKQSNSEKTSRIQVSNNVSTPSVTFVVDQDSGESFIQVVDRHSGEVLRQIPPEEARRLASALKEVLGHVVDTVA
jgi:flagellar protein FlaG